MADLKDDDLENENNDDNLDNKKKKKDKYDRKFKYYDFDDNTMHTMYLKNKKLDRVKIDKVSDYYNLFVSMLKSEDKILHTREHLWVLGVDARLCTE